MLATLRQTHREGDGLAVPGYGELNRYRLVDQLAEGKNAALVGLLLVAHHRPVHLAGVGQVLQGDGHHGGLLLLLGLLGGHLEDLLTACSHLQHLLQLLLTPWLGHLQQLAL